MPPQAYTKETLAKAYEWVKSQPGDIRRAATSSDTLVGLYLSAQRRRQEGFDSFYDRNRSQKTTDSTPVSGEEFKKELKNLAIGLNEFVDDREASRIPPSPLTAPPPQVTLSPPPHAHPTATHGATTITQPQPNSLRFSGEVQKTSSRQTTSSVIEDLDPVSQQRLATIKTSLNLSSETEALRMLIALGFEKIKGVLPSS